MEAIHVIKKPLITEKSTEEIEHNRYVFEVNLRADKKQIRKAIEELYNVRVLGVATMNRKGKVKRTKFGYTETSLIKRAIVKVHPEDRIELF